MSEIASNAGLKQSSLYYYFNRKEQILLATFTVARAPLDFIKRTGELPESAGVRLYRLLRFDTYQLCVAASHVNEVEQMAALQPDQFESFWEDRQELHDWVERLVQQGIDAGEFIATDVTLTALFLLSSNEGIQNWYRHQEAHRPGQATFSFPEYEAEAVASHYAETSLRSLLVRPSSLARIRRVALLLGVDDLKPDFQSK